MRRIVRIAVCLWCFAGPALGDQFDKYRSACSATELAKIQEALAKARELAQKAAAALPPKNSVEGQRFRKWFGGPEGDDDPVIRDIYVEISVMLAFEKVWCPTPTSGPITDDFTKTNAFVIPKTGREIFFGQPFFLLKPTGPMSSGGTIVHEVSHQSTKRKIGDDDKIYGPDAQKNRATLGASRARSTADNFKYFAEDVVYGVP